MAYLFTSNEWVYYSAILLCMFVAIIVYALENKQAMATIGPNAQEYQQKTRAVKVLTFVMLGYVVFWAVIRNGVVDTRQYIISYNAIDPDLKILDVFKMKDGSFDDKAPLFKAYQLILRKLGLNWHWYLGSIAVV